MFECGCGSERVSNEREKEVTTSLEGGRKKQRSRRREEERSSEKHRSSDTFFNVGCSKSGKCLSCALIATSLFIFKCSTSWLFRKYLVHITSVKSSNRSIRLQFFKNFIYFLLTWYITPVRWLNRCSMDHFE